MNCCGIEMEVVRLIPFAEELPNGVFCRGLKAASKCSKCGKMTGPSPNDKSLIFPEQAINDKEKAKVNEAVEGK